MSRRSSTVVCIPAACRRIARARPPKPAPITMAFVRPVTRSPWIAWANRRTKGRVDPCRRRRDGRATPSKGSVSRERWHGRSPARATGPMSAIQPVGLGRGAFARSVRLLAAPVAISARVRSPRPAGRIVDGALLEPRTTPHQRHDRNRHDQGAAIVHDTTPLVIHAPATRRKDRCSALNTAPRPTLRHADWAGAVAHGSQGAPVATRGAGTCVDRHEADLSISSRQHTHDHHLHRISPKRAEDPGLKKSNDRLRRPRPGRHPPRSPKGTSRGGRCPRRYAAATAVMRSRSVPRGTVG